MLRNEEYYPAEVLEKMKKWGVIKEDPNKCGEVPPNAKFFQQIITQKRKISPYYSISSAFGMEVPTWLDFCYLLSDKKIEKEEVSLKARIKMLETQCEIFAKKIDDLEQNKRAIEKPSTSQLIYDEQKSELEKQYFGKIVAIDNEERKVVGIGETILEAYTEAKASTKKDKFSFKRVGYKDRL